MTSCSLFRQTKYEKYVSYTDGLKDPQFLNIPQSQFKDSRYNITVGIANPYTCISKFIFISLDKSNMWEASSYRYRVCNQDTVTIEKINIGPGNRWDSVFNLIKTENLTSLVNPKDEIKRLVQTYPNRTYFNATNEEINYTFTFTTNKKSNTIEMNNVEVYKKWFNDNNVLTGELDKSIRLKYLLGLVFDFDTDFRFEK